MTRQQNEILLECREPSDFWFACVDLKVIRDKTLSPCDKTVYSVICSHADTRTRACPLKVGTIAEEANCCVRNVQESLKKLEARGVRAREERFSENGKQRASVYKNNGHRAECYMGADSVPMPAEGRKFRARGGAENDTPYLRESKTYENQKNKRIPPSEGQAKPAMAQMAGTGHELRETRRAPHVFAVYSEPPESFCPVSKAPPAMRQTAEYLLLESGRDGLTRKEIDALRALGAAHFPSVVQKQVSAALERVKRLGRDPATLTFCYVADAMRHFTPTRPAGTRTARASPVKSALSESERAEAKALNAWAESFASPENVAAMLEWMKSHSRTGSSLSPGG
jgi:hypothetical protein